MRLDHADYLDDKGDHLGADEYRLIVERMREQWAAKPGSPEYTKQILTGVIRGPDPDALVEPIASPESPMFWHEPRYDATVLCPCGHFADFLCDEPIGKGKTCDAPACRCCRNQIGDDIDQCQFHATTKPREPR